MTDPNHDDGRPVPQNPRSEPEIIPPGQTGGRARGVWVTVNDQAGEHRVYVAQPGPFTIILVLAIIGLIAAVALIVLLSLALIWIPLVMALILAFVASMYWQRFRHWRARR